mgnify:FL=1
MFQTSIQLGNMSHWNDVGAGLIHRLCVDVLRITRSLLLCRMVNGFTFMV